jgi:hypothetical protein
VGTHSVLFGNVCTLACHAEQSLFELNTLRICGLCLLKLHEPILLHACVGQVSRDHMTNQGILLGSRSLFSRVTTRFLAFATACLRAFSASYDLSCHSPARFLDKPCIINTHHSFLVLPMLSLDLTVNFTQTSRLFPMQRKLVPTLSDPSFDVVPCGGVDLSEVSTPKRTMENGSRTNRWVPRGHVLDVHHV